MSFRSQEGSLSRGVSVQGESLSGGSVSSSQKGVSVQGATVRGSLSGRPPYGDVWAVRILFERIPVSFIIIKFFFSFKDFILCIESLICRKHG